MNKKHQKTAQRAAIMNYLEGNTSHPSARDIYEAVQETLSTVSLATVYNNLIILEEEGLIREIPVPGGNGKRYDANIDPHDHLICTSCRKIIDIPAATAVKISPEHLQGFTVQDVSVKIYGLCPDCRNQAEGRAGKIKTH
ncbi:MAG: transcriptional repressor [Deltaproteobacteria bacterium]|jgi:Fur family peroxide stress response transcriptional regulator